MKYIGFIICVSGIILLGYAFNMDTSIAVDYPNGNTFGLPERVNNMGLMADKQNYMIFGVVLVALGILTIITYDKKKDDNKYKACPKCAEKIKKEALVCRFCNYSFPIEKIEKELTINEESAASEIIKQNLNTAFFKK